MRDSLSEEIASPIDAAVRIPHEDERLPMAAGLAWQGPMARHFSELACWQLARRLQREVFRLLKRQVFASHPKFRGNLNDAASSARRNIAEGFGRRGHKEFARFLNFSLSSLKEVEDGLIECMDNEWLTAEETAAAFRLCKRATVATSRLRNSIKDKPDPPESA